MRLAVVLSSMVISKAINPDFNLLDNPTSLIGALIVAMWLIVLDVAEFGKKNS